MTVSLLLICLGLVQVSVCDLSPGTRTEFITRPGMIYIGSKKTYMNVKVADEEGTAICSNLCKLSSNCGAFYMDSTLCTMVERSDAGNIMKDDQGFGLTYYVVNQEGMQMSAAVPRITTTAKPQEVTTAVVNGTTAVVNGTTAAVNGTTIPTESTTKSDTVTVTSTINTTAPAGNGKG
ncbi:uncharacterized protein LOC111707377 [Eurytemora carolleeae]|uniref:uncharacterized protein LOC111707377 n=1 Tax=Eurytemora carolleeae TaxID=1294199 RepID=UPI000C7606EC|nr:uncharacterized protein LOC111707377 [Eurytemora carolleeae]|eukprot:XP_023336246.1 uncharacterized protein LOC111707377 [Eurytemora affinis]